jgi:hypothetical protein
MATPAIFNKNLVDLTGLNSFWEAAKAYIDGQIDATEELVNNLSTGQVTANKKDIATINEKIAALGTGSTAGSIKTAIETAVNDLATGQVTDNKKDIATLKGRVDTLSDNLNANIDGRIDIKLNPVIETVAGHTTGIEAINTKLSKAGIDTNGVLPDGGTINTAINTAVNVLATGQVAANTNAIAGLNETVAGHTTILTNHGNAIEGLPGVMDDKITIFKQSLDYAGGDHGANKYASKVVMSDGELTVTYTDLPDIDGKDDVVLTTAKKYTDDEIAEHAALPTHITPAERTNWNAAATSINTFLTSTTTDTVINNLTEINKWFTEHEGEYGELLASVQQNTTGVAANLASINALNDNLATITIASVKDCTAIVTGN